MSDTENTNLQRRIMFWGMILFLLGLVLAFGFMPYINKRMGMSVHLQGVMNGTFMVVVGLLWTHIYLSNPGKKFVFYSILIGSYGNYLATLLAALWGAGGALSPITGGGFTASPWQEHLVGVLFPVCGVSEILCILTILWGLRRVSNL